MSASASPMKKTSVCRYFAASGSCFHGDNCQFLHDNPAVNNDHAGGGGPDGNNGDQFFNATFNAKGGPMGSPRKDDMHLNEQLAAMSIQKQMVLSKMQQSHGQKMLQTPPTFQGRNPGASEFIPHSTTTPGIDASLRHSNSSPSFASYGGNLSMISSNNSNTPAIGSLTQNLSLIASASPMGSPGLSPSSSPMIHRRSPVSTIPTNHTSSTPTSSAASNSLIHENVGGTTYFYTQEEINTSTAAPQTSSAVIMPNFTMYPGVLPHVAHMKVRSHLPSFFMPDELKLDILNRHAMTIAQIDPENSPEIPAEVDNYHSLFPLEPPPINPMHKSSTFGYPTTVYKAVNVKDGLTYVLRRVHGFRLTNTKCMSLIDMWKKIQQANIVQLREVFTTKAFGDHSMVFVYDFHPGAETAMSRYFQQNHGGGGHHNNGFNMPFGADGPRPYSSSKGKSGRRGDGGHQLLSEATIWSFVIQLANALRVIHAHGLACRVVDPTKILMTGKTRLRINCIGIFDVLSFDNSSSSQQNPLAMMPVYQQEDLMYLGKIVIALACSSLQAFHMEQIPASLDYVQRNYSPDLKNLLVYVFNPSTGARRSINDVMPMIGARFFVELEAATLQNDVLENEISKEVENSRLFRLMCKLGTVNERPEYSMDPAWSETGDRYLLKLFRDYVFHQVDEGGAPWVDMAHIVACLNKLDAGVPEKVTLMSRDEQSILVVTYAELKRCLDAAFGDILTAQHQSEAGGGGQ